MQAKKVVIFGAGPTGVRVIEKYKKFTEIIAITDNDPAKWGLSITLGSEIVSPEKLKSMDFDLVIIASVQGKSSIQNQLRKMGIDDEKIYFDSGFQEDKRRVLYKQYNKLLENIPGSVAELGVFQGNTAAIINEAFPNRKLYLFDTFEGFNSADIATEQEKCFSQARAGEFSDTNVELVLEKMPHPKMCVPKKGWFPDSAKDVGEEFALVRIDVDLYEPTLAGLNWFSERLSLGGFILVDDYFNENYAGVKAAVDEWLNKHHERKLLPFGVGFSAVLA